MTPGQKYALAARSGDRGDARITTPPEQARSGRSLIHFDTPKRWGPPFLYPCVHDVGMSRRVASGGRPSKGERITLLTRTPTGLALAVRAEAERLDMSYSDYIANVLATAHGFPLVSQPADQAQMKLTA